MMEHQNTYKALDVANWFINQFDKNAGDVITHLKLQKLLYYAEAWTQVLLERELFQEEMEAWTHGPVVPEVWQAFRDYSWGALNPTGDAMVQFDDGVVDILNQVMETYGSVSAKVLEEMTHMDQPWIDARGDCAPEARCNEVIPKRGIRKFFREKYEQDLDG